MLGAMTVLRYSAVLAALAVALALGGASPLDAAGVAPAAAAEATLPAPAWTAIRRVIDEQLTALKAGDGTKAFSFAAPAIRDQFATPENFLRMVRSSYAPLLAARYKEFLPGAVIEGSVIQPLRLIAADNTVLVALYTMERQDDGSWKITSCLLAPSTVRAA
jgi:hypothetical protein